MSISKEFKAGIFTLAGVVLIVAAIVVTTRISLFRRGYYINIRYSSVSDLKPGSAVIFAGGIKIGYIRSITIVSNLLNVRCWIENRYRIDRNAYLIITSSGLMGSKFINIEVFQPSGTYFEPDDIIMGVNPVSLDALTIKMGNALNTMFGESFMPEDMKKSFVFALKNTSELLYNLNKTVKENEGNVELTLKQLGDTVNIINKNLKTMLVSLDYMVKNAENFSRENTADLKNIIESISKASSEIESASKDLKIVIENSKDITEAIKTQRGTVGKLIYDKTVYQSILKSVKNIEDATEKMKKSGSLIKVF